MDQLTGPTQDAFTHLITSYANAVDEEWDSMTDPDARAAAERALRNLYAAVLNGFSEGEQNRMIQQRLLASLDSLSIARQHRLSMAQDVVSAGQWLLVSGLGLLLMVVVVVALGHARFPLPRGVAMAAMTAAITLALFVIVAHDRPFVGNAALSPQPILRAAGVAQ